MKTLTLVTGNKGKLAEWKRLLPTTFSLQNLDVDLDEIQSLDLETIIVDKVKRAYKLIQKPIVVEDISAGLDKLNGLPGPFIKFFESSLGKDALYKLAETQGDPATVRCIVAYYDGQKCLVVQSKVKGTVVAKRGQNGFGFDCVFVPSGQNKTYGEMTPQEKDVLSHRSKAIKQLVKKLGVD